MSSSKFSCNYRLPCDFWLSSSCEVDGLECGVAEEVISDFSPLSLVRLDSYRARGEVDSRIEILGDDGMMTGRDVAGFGVDLWRRRGTVVLVSLRGAADLVTTLRKRGDGRRGPRGFTPIAL